METKRQYTSRPSTVTAIINYPRSTYTYDQLDNMIISKLRRGDLAGDGDLEYAICNGGPDMWRVEFDLEDELINKFELIFN